MIVLRASVLRRANVLFRASVLLTALAIRPPSASAQDAVGRDAAARADSIRADSALEARTAVLAVQLRCAVCQGISIQESPSALAREMREVVKEQLRDGRTEAEVKAYFVSKYGEWILLAPPARGFNLLLYALPVLLLLGGLAGIVVVVRRWSTPSAAEPNAPSE